VKPVSLANQKGEIQNAYRRSVLSYVCDDADTSRVAVADGIVYHRRRASQESPAPAATPAADVLVPAHARQELVAPCQIGSKWCRETLVFGIRGATEQRTALSCSLL